jgi:hypothetical protein
VRPISAWNHMMSTSVLIAAKTGQDTYGKPTYGSDVSYKAHLARGRTLVRTATGQQIESGQAVYISGTPAVQPTARLTLSTADVGSTEAYAINPTIQRVERLYDGNGAHHVVLWL